jgi:hypothetical protein
LETADERKNTNLWAHAVGEAERPSARQTIEIGDIETGNMNL